MTVDNPTTNREEIGIPKSHLKLKSILDMPRLKTYCAELFWNEIQKIIKHSPKFSDEESFSYVTCYGNSGKSYTRDVIDVAVQSHLVGEKYEDYNVLALSRNGIYQSLPEALFHPLTLGHVYSNVDDIVHEIRYNASVTNQCRQFFSLFDTLMFEYKAELLERQMAWPYQQQDNSIIRLVQEFYKHDLEHTYTQAIVLLSSIVYNESIKCSYDLQAQLLKLLLDKEVKIKEIPYYHNGLPYNRLGSNTLGIDVGLMGKSQAELDDLLLELWLDSAEEVDDYMADEAKKNYIYGVMDCFDMTSRNVHIKFQISDSAARRELGKDGYLGVNLSI